MHFKESHKENQEEGDFASSPETPSATSHIHFQVSRLELQMCVSVDTVKLRCKLSAVSGVGPFD